FFCSGFLLMMGRQYGFFNWYKRRINRIFPTVFAVAIIGIVVFGRNPSLRGVLLYGGGWFVQAILVFYAVFWFVKKYLSGRLWIAYAVDAVVVLVWFALFWDKELFFLENATYLRWPCFFATMLLGASAYRLESSGRRKQRRLGRSFVVLFALLVLYYGYQLLEGPLHFLKQVQIVLLPVLAAIIWTVYEICSHPSVLKVYRSRYVYLPVYYISACCLEIYLSGRWSFPVGLSMIKLFPLNILVTFILIFIVAYIVKVFSNFLGQTVKTEPYDWKAMVRL
ncbi:MAG: hypothetical protein IJS66_02910, partial [Bacteroidales bacterium]|nr:hypothetical protein [Bacteroidales bacterium]